MSSAAGPDISEQGLILYIDAANRRSYPGTGTVWTDMAGNNNSGSLTNGPTFSMNTVDSIVLDGVNDHVVLPDNFFNHNAGTPFTVSIWFRTAVSSGILLGQQNTNTVGSATGYVPAIYIDNANKIRTTCFWGNDGGNQSVSTTNVTDNLWHNITVTFASSTHRSYLDGSLYATLAKTQTNYSSIYYYFLGAGSMASWPSVGANAYFTGNIGSFSFYNRQLSNEQVLQNFNATRSRFGI